MCCDGGEGRMGVAKDALVGKEMVCMCEEESQGGRGGNKKAE